MALPSQFIDVTEVAGEPISGEQLERLQHRYRWALPYCEGRRVVEAACGSGPGIGLLHRVASSYEAGDVSQPLIEVARRYYGERVRITRFDAQEMPFADHSQDIIVLFEALYYLPDPERFVRECSRVLCHGGHVLIATANKDLSDFNPSPHSHRYFGATELHQLLTCHGFGVELFGYLPVSNTSLVQRALRPVKRAVVALNLMPGTMRGKRLLKRLVFGKPVTMPAELDGHVRTQAPMRPISPDRPDREHKVLYAAAKLVKAG